MARLVLSAEQIAAIVNGDEVVELCDPSGKSLGLFVRSGFIDELKRRRGSDEPRQSTQQVVEHLESLESNKPPKAET